MKQCSNGVLKMAKKRDVHGWLGIRKRTTRRLTGESFAGLFKDDVELYPGIDSIAM